MIKTVFRGIICVVFMVSCNGNGSDKEPASAGNAVNMPVHLSYTVIKSFPHDTSSFTEGLLVHHGQLFESTGHTAGYAGTRSLFGIVNMNNGKIDTRVEIDKKKYFGEGIVFLKDKVYQLTLSSNTCFIYDTGTFKKTGIFHYNGEGWGLTTDGVYIIMSNGSSNIVYRDAADFAVVKTLNVTDNNGPVPDINELELINGFIYANQWLTNDILKIDTASGRVVGKLDLSALAAEAKTQYSGAIEMNGIAYDSATSTIYITGKLWPRVYEIKLNP